MEICAYRLARICTGRQRHDVPLRFALCIIASMIDKTIRLLERVIFFCNQRNQAGKAVGLVELTLH